MWWLICGETILNMSEISVIARGADGKAVIIGGCTIRELDYDVLLKNLLANHNCIDMRDQSLVTT